MVSDSLGTVQYSIVHSMEIWRYTIIIRALDDRYAIKHQAACTVPGTVWRMENLIKNCLLFMFNYKQFPGASASPQGEQFSLASPGTPCCCTLYTPRCPSNVPHRLVFRRRRGQPQRLVQERVLSRRLLQA